mmetsp:Transcript_194/g.383  ORF Transcript_194/g.383 Transcript_194/m.383 type:complete len:163 (-) Transcript_194:931-1419(-)
MISSWTYLVALRTGVAVAALAEVGVHSYGQVVEVGSDVLGEDIAEDDGDRAVVETEVEDHAEDAVDIEAQEDSAANEAVQAVEDGCSNFDDGSPAGADDQETVADDDDVVEEDLYPCLAAGLDHSLHLALAPYRCRDNAVEAVYNPSPPQPLADRGVVPLLL